MSSKQSKTQTAVQMDWREEPEMPRKEEIMATHAPLLPRNEVVAPPGKKAQYLEAQYCLSRYEGTELLRRAVQGFREDPSMEESGKTAIYTNVAVHGYFVTRVGTLCRIGFCPSRVDKRIRWKHSARLTPGTVVALSTAEDKFKSICMIASVVQKELVGGLEPNLDAGEHKDTPPRVDIAWADPQDAVLDPSIELIMIEARNGYYESVRHTMRGLQNWSQYPSRFERYLIDGKPDDCAPRYMEALKHTVDLSSIVTTDTTTGRSPDPNSHYSVDVKSELPPGIANATGLDPSQLNALRHIFTSELAVIQGPPGTGKTFTSISALQVLLANIDSHKHPIVIATQTNHALDQILLLLAQAAKVEFVRLGRRSKTEFIASRGMFNLRKKSQGGFGGAEIGRIEARRKSHIAELKDLIGGCFPEEFLSPGELLANDLISQAQHDSLVGEDEEEPKNPFITWLDNAVEPCPPHRFIQTSNEWEEAGDPDIHNDQAVSIDDDEKDRLHGSYIPIVEQFNGRVDSRMMGPALWKRAQAMLNRYQDLWRVPREYRGVVYRLLRNQYIEVKADNLRALVTEGVQLTQDGRACRAKSDARIVQEFKIPIIGCTTTGLTKYRKLIENLNPRVMLIEEAAETREANITSALFPSLEQLILVGDHMQLAPHTDLAELSCEPYNLCLSLFERMINLKMGHAVLDVQRRMVPEIRRILKPFYPSLQDHESVLDKTTRPPIPGMGAVSSYFFCHRWSEERTTQQSRANRNEAHMIVGFVKHLVQNGTPASKITVLTFYRGQRRVIFDLLSRNAVLSNLNPQRRYNVCTVDGYQGEENDVIILSLVRSPSGDNPYNVGFLDNRNRVVVALSRARRGLYVFGNYNNLMRSGRKARKVWTPSLEVLIKKDRCHSRLPLQCSNHGALVEVRDPQDWTPLHGGCLEKCETQLDCGHVCQLLCHPYSHSRVVCTQPCSRELPCGHGCAKRCCDECRCGQKCKDVPEAPKRSNVNHINLEKFLGPEEEVDETPPVPAVEDVEPDLISIWDDDDDEIIPNEAVASDVSGSNASPDMFDCQDPSETGSESASPIPESGNTSPITASVPMDFPGKTPLLSGGGGHGSGLGGGEAGRAPRRRSKFDPAEDQKAKGEVYNGNGAHEHQVYKETFREVRVKEGCQREPFNVHHINTVHARGPNAANGGPKMGSDPVVEPVTPPSPPADVLVDFNAPACAPTVPSELGEQMVACLGKDVHSAGDETLTLRELGQAEVVVPEVAQSEFGILIEF